MDTHRVLIDLAAVPVKNLRPTFSLDVNALVTRVADVMNVPPEEVRVTLYVGGDDPKVPRGATEHCELVAVGKGSKSGVTHKLMDVLLARFVEPRSSPTSVCVVSADSRLHRLVKALKPSGANVYLAYWPSQRPGQHREVVPDLDFINLDEDPAS